MRYRPAYHDQGRRVSNLSSRARGILITMRQSVGLAGILLPWRGRAIQAGLLLVMLLVSTAFAPASFFAPMRSQVPAGVASMLSSGAPVGSKAALSASGNGLP